MKKNLILATLGLSVLAACGDDKKSASTSAMSLKGTNDTSLSLNSTIASQSLLSAIQSPSKLFATSGLDPATLNIKLYKFAVSTSNLCTDLTTVIDNSNPDYENFYDSDGIDFGSSSIDDGTYPCVALQVSDTLTFKPAETSDNNHCAASTTYSLDVCRSGSSTDDMDSGDSVACDSSENVITIYLSTASTGAGTGDSNPLKAPTSSQDGTNGINLGSALVKSGETTSLFIVNGDGAIEENGTDCDHQPPTFTFGKE